MKRCLKCGIDYSDNDCFCPVCGEKLFSANVCQHCGEPIDVNDTFCRKCGAKIEKEYRCEKCGALINENTKFCPECGNKIEKPVVTTKASNVKPELKQFSFSLEKALFLIVNSALLILLILAFVGCFGDILVSSARTSYTSDTSFSENQISIEYFFGKAVKDIQSIAESIKYHEYTDYLTFLLVLQYFFWISAIAMIVVGFTVAAINFYKGFTKGDYRIKRKPFALALTTVIPYLALFALTQSLNLKVTQSSSYSSSSYGGTSTMFIESKYGWGTTMIVITTIIGICILAISKIVEAYFEKKSVIREIICSLLKIAFFVVFIFSFGNVIGLSYSEDGLSVSGFMNVHIFFEQALRQYSAAEVATLSHGAINCMIGTYLLFFGISFGSVLFTSLFNTENRFVMYMFSFLMLSMMIVGYIVSYNGAIDYIKELGDSAASYATLDTIKYSTMGIVAPIITILAVVGIDVTKNIGMGQANA